MDLSSSDLGTWVRWPWFLNVIARFASLLIDTIDFGRAYLISTLGIGKVEVPETPVKPVEDWTFDRLLGLDTSRSLFFLEKFNEKFVNIFL